MPLPGWEDLDKITATYKTVAAHKLKCDILCPKNLPAGKHPVIIFWHGGGLVRSPLPPFAATGPL